MASEWDLVTLRDVFELIPGYAFKSADFIESGVPALKIKNIKANAIDLERLSYVDAKHVDSKPDKLVQFSDLLITMSGNRFGSSTETWVGKVAQFRLNGPYLVNQRVGILRAKRNAKINQRYCAFVLSSMSYQKYFVQIGTSSGGQANLSPKQILDVQIALPSRKEQDVIAMLLGSLDDRIGLLAGANASLETVARTMFTSWFVNYDAVQAKAEGLEPRGMDAATAALFPADYVDSVLGAIPRGWEVVSLADLIELPYGKALKAENRKEGNFPVMGSNGRIGWNDAALAKGPGIVVGRKGNPGTVTWVNEDFFPIDTTFYVKPRAMSRGMHIVRYQLATLDLPSLGADSAVPGLNREMAYKTKLPNPPRHLAAVFVNITEPLMQKIALNKRLSETLTDLRNALLPQLISGKLRIPEAEEMLEAVL